MRLTVLLVALAGCGMPPLVIDREKLVDGPEGWQEAAVMTCDAFGDAADCPPVYWYGPESMNCWGGRGFRYPGYECVTGYCASDGILVGMTADGMRPSETVMVHEIAHWFFEDGDHSDDRIWGENYHSPPPESRVGSVTVELQAAGL
jgi:hypothetical protein